jgi:hypothetical protein
MTAVASPPASPLRSWPIWTAGFLGFPLAGLAAAEAAGARLVSTENVYMYGRPLTEDRAYDAHTTKGPLRGRIAHDLLAAHDTGRVEVAIDRVSDYFGPGGDARSYRAIRGLATLHVRHYGHRRQSDFSLHGPTL